MTTEFAKRYKKMSDSELLEVLQNPSQYQSTALSIAKSEFASRKLSEKEIQEAKQVLLAKHVKKERQHEKIEMARIKLMDAGDTFYDTINPIQTTAPTSEKLIRIITLVFSGSLIYKIIVNLDLFSALIKGDSYERFGYTLFFFPILVELIAILLFWFKQKSGWTLLVIFCSYSLVAVFYGLYTSISLQFKGNSFAYFFPSPSPTAYIITALFYIGTLLVMQKQDIREVYKIDKQQMQGSLITGVLSGLLFLFLALSY